MSLFDLAGPDLIVILLIVLLLYGAKRGPQIFRSQDFFEAETEGNRRKNDRFSVINQVLMGLAILAVLILFAVLSSGL